MVNVGLIWKRYVHIPQNCMLTMGAMCSQRVCTISMVLIILIWDVPFEINYLKKRRNWRVFVNLKNHFKITTFLMIFTFYLRYLHIFPANLETFSFEVSSNLVQKELYQIFSHFEKLRPNFHVLLENSKSRIFPKCQMSGWDLDLFFSSIYGAYWGIFTIEK
jgi:hypothetical protein